MKRSGPPFPKLAGIGDEIASDVSSQLRVLSSLQCRFIELRKVDGKDVSTLEIPVQSRMKATIRMHGLRVSSIASQAGKSTLQMSHETIHRIFQRALTTAARFEAGHVRVFAFRSVGTSNPNLPAPAAMMLKKWARRANREGIEVVVENSPGTFASTPHQCRALLDRVDHSSLRLNFDTGSFASSGFSPFNQAYPILRNDIAYVHVKDLSATTGKTCLPGDGDADVSEVVHALIQDHFDGVISLEPHLLVSGHHGGFSGEVGFRKAWTALSRILAQSISDGAPRTGRAVPSRI